MAAKRPCPKPGCPTLINKGERACPTHRAEHERARGTRQQRGYNAAHDAERKRWAAIIARAPVPCARACGTWIHAGMAWDLGHTDDRTAWTGPECPPCNRAAGGRAAHGT